MVRYDDEQTQDYPPTTVKWASEAKSRFMQEASKAQERVQRTQVSSDQIKLFLSTLIFF